ncbi:MAG TPA: LacI family DNA-binding transcriptional regulator [Candidatus Dormibacteraeota bacterium]|jgi:DNA-binding LacI/PurR family transcriptional regulator|nr:LacI family DNA-binding transcriptional regulator [Candidatus Dormibacteraeota bacterium]
MTPPPRRKRATIRDVGRAARVSHQTVSRVINGETCIAPDTRAKVERAIAALGFRPSHIARSLVSRSTKTIGLVMGDVASPFFPDLVRGAEDVLSEAGYCLILSNSSRDPRRELRNVRHLLERNTDGLILGAPQSAPDELRDLAERAAVPMVFLNRDVKGPHVASVWIDWRAATTAVVKYLTDLGHRRVGLVVPSREEIRFANREDWYRWALGRADLVPDPPLILHEPITIEGGYRAGQRLLGQPDRPTAAICHSDVMAIGLLQACRDLGVRVPGDLSVVGWDDVPYASLVTPALTTVRVPRYDLGQAAARRLLDLIAGRPAADPHPLSLELVRRASCAAPAVSPSRSESNPVVTTKRARSAASVSTKGELP